MTPLTGTLRLLHWGLRRDRIRILGWCLGVGLTAGATVPAVRDAYPDAAARIARAELSRTPGTVVMTGPFFGAGSSESAHDPGVGAVVVSEIGIFLLVAVAVMSILAAVRHTRGDEEAGRTELVRALPTGRAAPASAAMLLVVLMNVLVGAVLAGCLTAAGLDLAGSLAFAASCLVTGLVFGALALCAAQLAERSRSAGGLAMAVLGVLFLVRAVGDVDEPDGGSWLSWLSPIAWAQQIRVFADLRWWPLGLGLGLVLLAVVVAWLLAGRRDLGEGLLPARRGRASAPAGLVSPAGMALRLLRPSIIGWVVALLVLGVVFGSLAGAIEDLVSQTPDIAKWLGGYGALLDSFGGLIASYLAAGVAALAVHLVLRLREEEVAGRIEHQIAMGAGRMAVMGGWLVVTAVGATLALLASAVGLGIGTASALGDRVWLWRMIGATTGYLPAVLAVMALTLALVGWAPRAAWAGWVLVGWIAVVVFFEDLLDIPDAVADFSPVALTPMIPAEEGSATILICLIAAAVVLSVIGLWGFRRRNMSGA